MVNSIKIHTHQLKFYLWINCSIVNFCTTLIAIGMEQMAWVLKVHRKAMTWEKVCPRREEWRQQQGICLFWILHWRSCGLEAGPNTLTKSSGKKIPSRECETRELHKRGQSGFRTGRKSSIVLCFRKCYHIWSSSYSNFYRQGVMMTHLIGQVAWRRAARPRWEAGCRRQDRCVMQAMPAWTCLLDFPLPLHSQIPMVAIKNTEVRGYSSITV